MLEFATQLVMGLKDIAFKIRKYKFRSEPAVYRMNIPKWRIFKG
jgi:hypothetical protein